jgi:glycyl-tRNA synthetase beta subunit
MQSFIAQQHQELFQSQGVQRMQEVISFIAQQHQELFQSQGVQRMQEVIDNVQRRVTPAMNEALLADYTEEEVCAALNGTGDLKAPGPQWYVCSFL